MKQIFQNLRNGATEVVEVPLPAASSGRVLARTSVTLVSAGTERMLVEFGKANWLDKARQQPDKVRMVLEKIRTDGLQPTIEAVFRKLDQPLPLGYCNVGRVAGFGSGVSGFSVGQRVVSNGQHAEAVSVPANLCAPVPDAVSDEAAAFTVLGAIGLQGIRLVQPTLGETVVVTGLGLIGLMTVQLLRAQGCRVLGLDFDADKLALARRFGAEVVDLSAGQDPVSAAMTYSRGRGVDAVLITAATKSSEPVHQAAQMCRRRGRIVLVGVTGLELSRADFYEKELSFQVSCSYGPGRYDPNYEERGVDYPVGFVRWTEQRNFEAVLDMMADGRLDVAPLISHRFDIEDAEKAYSVVAGSEPSLGILLRYPGFDLTEAARTVNLRSGRGVGNGSSEGAQGAAGAVPRVSFIGAGNYAAGVLIPAFKAAGARLHSVASCGGASGAYAGRKFGFAETTTDTDRLFADEATDAVVITTRHNSHARIVLQALRAGKHVFCEKPLCLTLDELAEIETAYGLGSPVSESSFASSDVSHPDGEGGDNPPVLMVGFNRRFAPQAVKIKSLVSSVVEPKAFVMTVNAGAIPADHWTQDPDVGGGRIVGEGCHFIDLLRFLAGCPIVDWDRSAMRTAPQDTVTISLRFADGSIGTIHYFANGAKSVPKERLEVFCAGRVLQLDNFRRLAGFGWPGFRKLNLWRQDKGQMACATAFVQALASGGPAPIPAEEVFEVSRVSIEIAQS